jgi:hypothetical protein
MNKQEKEWFQFLKSLPEDAFDNWLEHATEEELDLADRLFDEEKNGPDVEDFTEAREVLKQFTLKG